MSKLFSKTDWFYAKIGAQPNAKNGVPEKFLETPFSVRDSCLLEIRIHCLPVFDSRDDVQTDDFVTHLAEMFV